MTTIHITKIETDSEGMISKLISNEGNKYTLSQLLAAIEEDNEQKEEAVVN
jgi:pyruvate/2-oxoglutarate dehydrogenase complex dihydrolipoamide acyltransferase (E2) component